jgi:hypothetical protein
MSEIGTDGWFARVFTAADDHAAANGDGDHAVGDLQALFRAAFGLLSPARRRRFLEDPEVRGLADLPEYEGLLKGTGEGPAPDHAPHPPWRAD